MKQFMRYSLNVFVLGLLFWGCQKQVPEIPSVSEIATSEELQIKSAKPRLTEKQVLIREWIEWIYSQDASLAPWDDATGDKQYIGQPESTGTMMLAGGSSPELVNRAITISIAQYQNVFFPLVNTWNYWSACYPDKPDNGNIPNGAISNYLNEPINGKRTLLVNWDGSSLLPTKLKDLRSNSGYWKFNIDITYNPDGCTETEATFYADGFWLKIPLTLGTHTLEIMGDAESRRFKWEFSNHVIYTINVVN